MLSHKEFQKFNFSWKSLLVRKYKETGKLIDMPRRTHPKKLNDEMMAFLDEALTENDELTARQARCLLIERWPTLQVSLPTIKRIRSTQLGWVCTRPHYCQLLREVSNCVANFTCVLNGLSCAQVE